MRSPRARIDVQRRPVLAASFRNDVDDAADSAAAVADGPAALGHFNPFDMVDAGQGLQIDGAAAIGGALGIGNRLAVDEDENPVVAVQADIGRRSRHLFRHGDAVYLFQRCLHVDILISFQIFRRDNRRVRLFFLQDVYKRQSMER